MTSRCEANSFQSVTIVKIILLSYMALLAVLTILTHFAQTTNLTFASYARLGLIATGITLPCIGFTLIATLRRVTARDYSISLSIMALGILGALLAVVLNRPDIDDYFYVPNVVYYLENPAQKMGFDIHFVNSGGRPFDSIITNTSLPYEYLQGIFAKVSSTEYLFTYYFLFCAIAGFIIPLVYFYCLSHFEKAPLINTLSVLVMISIMLLLGENHRAIGNLSFARAFQGKMFFLAAGIPMFVAVTYDFFKSPAITSWLAVFITSIAMVGVSATAAVLLPALASVLTIVHLSRSGDKKVAIKNATLYLSALVYLVIYAVVVRSYALKYHGMDSPQNFGWPLTFWGTLKLLVNPQLPLTPFFALSSLLVAVLLCHKRRDLIVWVAAAITLYLNPFSSQFVMHHLTSPNIYWRMFFILPFPLMIGIAIGCLLEHLGRRYSKRFVVITAITSFAVLTLVNVLSPHASVLRSAGEPRFKIPENELVAARHIIATAPPGAMLAPVKVAGTVSMLTSRFPQLAYRPEGLKTWFFYRGNAEEAQQRLDAAEFLEGKNGRAEALKNVISSKPELRSIILAAPIWARADVQQITEQNGFRHHVRVNENFDLAWR